MKKNFKQNKAITLIALVITIIVLLILAGVTIVTLTGDNGLLKKASDAQKESLKAEGLEKLQVEIAGSYDNNGQIDTNQLKTNLQHISGLTTENDEPITNNTEIKLPMLVKINNNQYLIKADGSTKAKFGIDEYDVATHPETYYGHYVTNYNSPNDAGINAQEGQKWQIFMADDTNIYLIASNSVNKDYVALNYNYNAKFPDKMWFTNILGKYDTATEGNQSVSTILGKLDKQSIYHEWLNSAPLSNLANQKAVLSMLDTDKWNEYIDENSNKKGYRNLAYANYVIGGPTIEMFCDSYNITHEGDNIIAKSKNNTGIYYAAGYKIQKGYSEDADSVENLKVDSQTPSNSNVNNMYFKCSYWISSPSAYGRTRLVHVMSNGNCGAYYDYDFYGISFRPLVCLKSNVHFVQNSDGQTYSLELN